MTRNGNIVTTRLNEQMMSEIAQAGNGKYFRATSGNMGLNDLYAVLNRLEKTEMESRAYSEYEEQFPAIIWIVLGLTGARPDPLERKSKWFKNITLFR